MATRKNKAPQATQSTSKKTLTQRLELPVLHKWLAAIYALQAIALLVVSVGVMAPVQATFLTDNPLAGAIAGEKVPSVTSQHLFDVNVTAVLAVALLALAITHLLLFTRGQRHYEMELAQGRNSIRWIGYSVFAALVFIVVAMLAGIDQIGALIAVGGLVLIGGMAALLAEILAGWSLRKPKWLSYGLSCLSVAGSGVIVLISLIASLLYDGNVGAYMYAVYITLVLIFVASALAQYRLFKGKGVAFLQVERVYMLIGLIGATAVVWQIFAGALRP